MAHRLTKGLVGGCAVLLGVTIAGCGNPQYTYIANSSANTYFKVPYGWHKISASSLTKATGGATNGAWAVAYEAGAHPAAGDYLSFNTSQPFVFALIAGLSATQSDSLSYDALRDFFLPVTSTAQTNLAEQYAAAKRNDPFTNFVPIRDAVVTPGHQGVHGVRETFDYTFLGGSTDTFDEIILTNADQTEVYLLVLHCTTACFSNDQAEINDVMSSFTIGSP